jgi:hypothetical protein
MGALPTAAFNLIVTGNLLRERRRLQYRLQAE